MFSHFISTHLETYGSVTFNVVSMGNIHSFLTLKLKCNKKNLLISLFLADWIYLCDASYILCRIMLGPCLLSSITYKCGKQSSNTVRYLLMNNCLQLRTTAECFQLYRIGWAQPFAPTLKKVLSGFYLLSLRALNFFMHASISMCI